MVAGAAEVVPLVPIVAAFTVEIRNPDGELVQISIDGNPTVAQFIADIVEEFCNEGEEEDVFGPLRDLYLSTNGGKRLPNNAFLSELVVSGQRVVLHRRLRGGMQSGNLV